MLESAGQKRRCLDLFCCAGGATRGLQQAGFYVVGVDIKQRNHYIGDEFHQADALDFPLAGYDFIWASPPCQEFSSTRTLHTNKYPDLVTPIRERLLDAGTPWVIENVNGAPLRRAVMLCGQMFGLKVFRHRWFESSHLFLVPPHMKHNGTCDAPVSKSRGGGGTRFGGQNGYVTVAGNNFNREVGMSAMGITWKMTQNEVAEAIPPAYSHYIGDQMMPHVLRAVAQREAPCV